MAQGRPGPGEEDGVKCRLIEASFFADRMESAFDRVRTNVVPRVKELPGFRGAYWLADREGGKFYAATFFDSEESLDASRDPAQQIRAEGMQEGVLNFDAVKEFEVIATTGDKVSTTATHARVTRTQNDPSRFNASVAAINSTVIPEAQVMQGFQGGFRLGDREVAGSV